MGERDKNTDVGSLVRKWTDIKKRCESFEGDLDEPNSPLRELRAAEMALGDSLSLVARDFIMKAQVYLTEYACFQHGTCQGQLEKSLLHDAETLMSGTPPLPASQPPASPFWERIISNRYHSQNITIKRYGLCYQIAFAGAATLSTIAAINWLWPLAIFDEVLKPYSWCVFMFAVFASRRWSGQISSWLLALAGILFSIGYMPGGVESMSYRGLVLIMIAGAGKTDMSPKRARVSRAAPVEQQTISH